MKNKLSIILIIITAITAFVIYRFVIYKNNQIHPNLIQVNSCSVDQSEVDLYSDQIIAESVNLKNKQIEIEKGATDGSGRKIYADKNNKVVLIKDEYSGESGFRIVSVILRKNKVVKIIVETDSYTVPPIEDPNSVSTKTFDEFFINDSKICVWNKNGIKINVDDLKSNKNYYDTIVSIAKNAEVIASTTKFVE